MPTHPDLNENIVKASVSFVIDRFHYREGYNKRITLL